MKIVEKKYEVADVQGVFQFLKNNYRRRLVLIGRRGKLEISIAELPRTYCFVHIILTISIKLFCLYFASCL